MTVRYSEINVLEDLLVLESYVGARKTKESALFATALTETRQLLKTFKVTKVDLRILYSIFARIVYVKVFIEQQQTATGRKPSGTVKATSAAVNIEQWIRRVAGTGFPVLAQEPTAEDKLSKRTLELWHYVVNHTVVD